MCLSSRYIQRRYVVSHMKNSTCNCHRRLLHSALPSRQQVQYAKPAALRIKGGQFRHRPIQADFIVKQTLISLNGPIRAFACLPDHAPNLGDAQINGCRHYAHIFADYVEIHNGRGSQLQKRECN